MLNCLMVHNVQMCSCSGACFNRGLGHLEWQIILNGMNLFIVLFKKNVTCPQRFFCVFLYYYYIR